MNIQLNASKRLAATEVTAASDTVHLAKMPFVDLNSDTKDGAKKEIEAFLTKHASGSKITSMGKDVNGEWVVDVTMPKAAIKKFAHAYSGGASKNFYEDFDIDEKGNSTKTSTKPAKNSNYPEWLASMSDKHREAYFKEHPTSKYAK